MIDLLKKGIQIFSSKPTQYDRLHISAENEYLAMCCGAFNPQLLAKIKRSNANEKH